MSTPLDEMRAMRDDLANSMTQRQLVADTVGIKLSDDIDIRLLARLDDRIAELEADTPPEIPEMWLIVYNDRHPVRRVDFEPQLFPPEVIAVIHVTSDGTVTLERT